MNNAYTAATSGTAYLVRDSDGGIEVTERDRLALIHRLSTNAVEKLQPGEGAATVLTTNIGRIIDQVIVLAIDDATAYIITNAGRGPQIAQYLQRNIFFNDQLKVHDRSESTSQLHLYGPQATALLEQLTGATLHDLPLWHHVASTLDGCAVRLVRIRPIHGGGWLLMADMAAIEAIGEALDEAGAGLLDDPAFTALRIEAGYAGLPELTQEYIPLEANLWDMVNFNKGCYVGQEIIARMESRGRMAKKLMGLHLAADVPVPATLTVAGKDAGDLTSVAVSPRYEHPIGLGYVRTAYAEPGTVVQVGDVQATVVALPFEPAK